MRMAAWIRCEHGCTNLRTSVTHRQEFVKQEFCAMGRGGYDERMKMDKASGPACCALRKVGTAPTRGWGGFESLRTLRTLKGREIGLQAVAWSRGDYRLPRRYGAEVALQQQ